MRSPALARRARACVLILLAACGDDVTVAGPPAEPPVRSVRVSPSVVTLRVAETAVLVADVDADSGVARTVTWASADPRRATVSATGIVTGVAPGPAVITATATADTTRRAFVEVTVVPGQGVKSIAVVPTSVVLNAGETQALSVTIDADPGVSRTATFVSASPSTATVDATGKITAVAPGATTIRVASTVDTTIATNVGVTVRTPRPASVSIQSITTGSTNVPVNIQNVVGQIEFSLNVDPGDEHPTRVEVMLNNGARDTVVAAQEFTAAQQSRMIAHAQRAGALDTLDADRTDASAAATVITLSYNTAAFDPATGNVAIRNGSQIVRASVTVSEGNGTRRASNDRSLFLNNLDGFYASVVPLSSTGIGTARDAAGLEWVQGGAGLVFTTTPVMYSGRAVGTRVISFPGRAPAGAKVSTKTGVAVDTLVLPPYSTPTTGAPYATGDVAAITAVDAQGGTLMLVGTAGTDGAGFVNAGPVVAIGTRLPGLRVDNTPPPAGAMFTISTSQQNSNNWINGVYQFATGLTGIVPDVGVGLRGNNAAPTAASVEATYFAIGGTLADSTEVTRGSDLEPSNVHSTYVVQARYTDRLGNRRTVALTGSAAHPLTTFGVDVQAPTVRYLTTPPAGQAAIGISSDSIYTAVTSAGNPLVYGVEAIDDRSGFGATPVSTMLTRFSQPNPAGTFDGTQTCVVGTVVAGLCTPQVAALVTTMIDNFRQLTTPLDGGTGAEGYYTYTASVRDQAGNVSGTRTKRVLFDVGAGPSAPQVTGIGMPPFLFGGQPAAFMPTATDNVELARGLLYVTYPNLPMTPAIVYDGGSTSGFAIGVAFDNQLTSPVQGGFGFTVPSFIRGLEITDATDAPQPYAAATVKPTGVNAVFFDFVSPGNPATVPANVPILALSVDAPTSSPGFAALTGANALSKWRRFPGGTSPLRFEAIGPSGQTVSPFARVMLLQLVSGVAPNAQAWRVVTELTAATGTDNGISRIWTYDFGSLGSGTFIAVGVSASGDAIATQPTTF